MPAAGIGTLATVEDKVPKLPSSSSPSMRVVPFVLKTSRMLSVLRLPEKAVCTAA